MMSGCSLISLLSQSVNTHGRRPAFIEHEQPVSYVSFFQMVEEVSHTLRMQGTGNGDRITFRMANSVRDMATGLGIIAAGACLVPVPFEATEPEKQGYIAECRATHDLVADDGRLQVRKLPQEYEGAASDVLQRAVIIRPTSGTTGKRKGVILSESSITGRIIAVNQALGIGPSDTILWTLPVSFHLVVSILLYLIHGATVVLAQNHYPDTLLDMGERHPVTMLYGGPRQFSMLAADRSGRTFPSLRWAISTGTFLPEGVADVFAERFNHPLRQAYGLIEVGLAAINSEMPPDPSDSVGRPAPGHSIMIRNRTGSSPLSEGEEGEIMIRGPGMFEGYVNAPCPFDSDGWFASGDMGLIRGGVLYVKGRECSVIHVAGMKVFPEEIEACLLAHTYVHAVRVYGTRHPRMGQVITADLSLRKGAVLTEKQLFLFCRERLSPWKIPVNFNINVKIDRTGSGKVLRHSI